MKTKFKLIAGALATAALSTGIVASAATTSSPWGRPSVEELHMDAVRVRNDPEWIKNFEEALLEGKSPVDPVYAVYNEVVESDEIMPAYLSQVFGLNDGNKLTLVHDASEYGYNLWSGRITTSNVSAFSMEFSEPATFTAGVTGREKAAIIMGKSGYYGNYKKATVYGTFKDSNGNTYTRHSFNEGTASTVFAMLSSAEKGELVELACYFYLHDGTGVQSCYRDVAVVHVVNYDYANSGEYAAKPYAGLIDCYTYVDTDSLGVMPPAGAE
ncbi:MAG: hypothetical protein K2N56_12210 [Oscillospiraceae bacterium]|nr:hypothetical protein [Oscillospiraceae bacterium]